MFRGKNQSEIKLRAFREFTCLNFSIKEQKLTKKKNREKKTIGKNEKKSSLGNWHQTERVWNP